MKVTTQEPTAIPIAATAPVFEPAMSLRLSPRGATGQGEPSPGSDASLSALAEPSPAALMMQQERAH
jgi:hypothetical protein